jgi:hypothetical protein
LQTPDILDDRSVADLMLTNPKTAAGDATVQQVRELLANPRVQLVLLADGRTFRGAVTEIPDDADPQGAALQFAQPEPELITAGESAAVAFARARQNPYRRLIVVDEHDTLLGLVCLNRAQTGFCGAA